MKDCFPASFPPIPEIIPHEKGKRDLVPNIQSFVKCLAKIAFSRG